MKLNDDDDLLVIGWLYVDDIPVIARGQLLRIDTGPINDLECLTSQRSSSCER